MWWLTELNFCFELLALDRRIGPADQVDEECQEAVQDCLQIESVLVVEPGDAKTGLQSCDWQSCLPCLFKLRNLMRGWLGVKPPALLQEMSVGDYKESDVLLLEAAVARFYTDSFICFFGRAAIIPTCLP